MESLNLKTALSLHLMEYKMIQFIIICHHVSFL